MCGSSSTWEIIARSNFALERAGIRSVVQKSRECFLPCQLVSTRHCLLLAPVRWKQWWIHVDPRMMLHFLLGNCYRAGEKEHQQLLQEHFSFLLLKCCRARFCNNSNKSFPVEFLSFFIRSSNAGNPTCNLRLSVSLLSLLTTPSTSKAVIAVKVLRKEKSSNESH